MDASSKIIIASAIVAFVAVVVIVYAFFSVGLATLDNKQEKTTIFATPNVEIEATTFNGNIIIESTAGDQIEVIYDLAAPQGHLNEITTSTTNQTNNGNMKIVAESKIEGNGIKVNYRASITMKLPNSAQYSLTLNTLNGNIIKPFLNNTNVLATTSNGYVDIKDANADSIEASTLNGNVNIHLLKGTLFQVDANTSNGNVNYQGIAMDTSIHTATRLKGNTTEGTGHLNVKLSTANGNIMIEYVSQ